MRQRRKRDVWDWELKIKEPTGQVRNLRGTLYVFPGNRKEDVLNELLGQPSLRNVECQEFRANKRSS